MRKELRRKLLTSAVTLAMLLPAVPLNVLAVDNGGYQNEVAQERVALQQEGVYSHRNWEPDSNDEFSPGPRFNGLNIDINAPHFFGATRSEGIPGVAQIGVMSIESVSVIDGGQYQARYRGQVGAGFEVAQGESGNWYTEAENAALMDGRTFTFHTEIPADALEGISQEDFLNNLGYTYGGLAFENWLGGPQFNNAGQRFIHFVGHELVASEDGNYMLLTTIDFRSPYPAANPANINIPWAGYRGTNQQGFSNAMRHVIGTFDLDINIGDETLASLPINLNLYDDFHLWGEVDRWARDLRQQAGPELTVNNRHVNVTSLGQSTAGHEMWNIVVADSQDAVNDYFTRTRPRMTGSLEELLALRTEVENGVPHRLPLYFNNIHPDEVTGVCAQVIMVEQLLNEEYITFETITEDQTHGIRTGAIWGTPTPHPNGYVSVGREHLETREDTTTVTISVEEALARFIFVFVPTNNPDGHDSMLRGNSYGFDLNRDASYQTQIENRLLIADVMKWNPIAFLEFHGHVAHMLIEPTTGPHNPNYEYDLLQPAMLRAAHIMGRASISGAYERYLIPAEHMTDGWDDGGPMYMPIFLSMFGILGFTLEIPHTNQDSLDANIAMGWAFLDHAMDEFDELFLNKLEYKRRGMTNADYADLVDPFFRNPFTSPPTVIGRPRQEGLSFFPDYWVIPVDSFNQMNNLEAYNMLEKLERHQVHIERTTAPITHDGTTFPTGTYVIDMRQAHRGYVNTMLETGYDASFFTAMYAEITMNFPHLRGFNAESIWSQGLFDGVTTPVSELSVPATTLADTQSTYVTIRNNSQDSVRLINDLLRADVEIHMLTSYAQEGLTGDFIVPRAALNEEILADRFIETTALEAIPASVERVVQPRIALLKAPQPLMQGLFSPAPYIMRDLGFEHTVVTSNAQLAAMTPGVDFNIIVNHNQNFAAAWNISNTHNIPTINVQTNAATAAVTNLFAGRGTTSNNIPASREGTFQANWSQSSKITTHNNAQDAAYLIGATTFASIPTETTPLVTVADGAFSDVFLGGWWQGAANQNNTVGRAISFTGLSNAGVPTTVFGTNIFNRAHSQAYHNIFATAAFMHTSNIQDQARPFVNATIDGTSVELNAVASEVRESDATITRTMFKVSNNPQAPVFNEADDWKEYTGAITINPEMEFVHWYVENSYGISAQGNLSFGIVTPMADLLRDLAPGILENGLTPDNLPLVDGELRLQINGIDIVLATNVNNRNVSGEVTLSNGQVLRFDIRGNGSNVRGFEIL
ncbi:MAG: hypothetical protein LBV67_01230 [Streptococcaceae bacterium]|jgi:hypothetical protein|nr:hypothetical protein [Streptococcaceae bacterium]